MLALVACMGTASLQASSLQSGEKYRCLVSCKGGEGGLLTVGLEIILTM